MSGTAVGHDITRERQRAAADPAGSAWVSANAGSGKTWVLTRRVIRILLGGTPAHRLLCLTFTKAAAATMSNRVFAELGRWTRLDDATLAAAIAEIEGEVPSPRRLARARALFAEAIETPGGLKIQTIHAFCESILQQFPLEADLGGNFEILETSLERELIAEARAGVLVAASAADPAGPLGGALAALLDTVGEFGLGKALDAVVAARDDLRRWLRDAGDLDAALAGLADALGVDRGTSDAALQAEMLASPEFPPALVDRLIADYAASSKNDVAQAERLGRARDERLPPDERLAAWWSVFFTQKDEAKAARSLATRAIVTAHPDLVDRCGREVARLERLSDRRAALATVTTTAALLELGDRMIGRYEAAKRSRGALDFDDLVSRTADLLSRSEAARWVQYKLDQGIDHILVDEAQDTSPRQWRIVRGLADDFFAGEGARPRGRTIFAVGDEKQSIYSFQGAAPDQFSANRGLFGARATAAGTPFADVKLFQSFRSTADVLGAVDRVFADPERRAAVVADPADYTDHTAARGRAPGLVEIWPMIRAERVEAPDDWTAPLDRPGPAAPWVRLATRIADEVDRLLAPDFRLPGSGRPVGPRDILILVRKRGAFVAAMNRVLEARGIAVAGADRLRLTDHIAVADLLALGRSLLLPEDDLSLACLLKSPLVGLDDDCLMAITDPEAPLRRESLADGLARGATHDPRLAAAVERLTRWREWAATLPTFELFARILGADGGRRRFVARLGPEVEDVLDEFMALALTSDRGPAPSLVRFLEGLAADAPEIKRDLDESRDELRVMTVHGAKGLEAPVVFLVDGGAGPVHAAHDPALVLLELPGRPPEHAPALVWSRGSADPAVVAERRAAHRRAAAAEYLRLLYVAMTRAADRLIVCGWSGVRGPAADCWHQVVEGALAAGCEEIRDAAGEVIARRWQPTGGAPVAPVSGVQKAAVASEDPPDWIDRPPPAPDPVRRLTPSRPWAEADADRDGARRRDLVVEPGGDVERIRGVLAHRLLERLPRVTAAERPALARRLVAAGGRGLDEPTRAALIDEVLRVIATPSFAAVFSPEARAEVPIVGRIRDRSGGRLEVSGRIDRLIVGAREVLIVDHKTDRRPPDDGPTAAQIGQMALYRALLRRLHPGRAIRAAILWTALPRLDEIAPDLLDAAEKRLALS